MNKEIKTEPKQSKTINYIAFHKVNRYLDVNHKDDKKLKAVIQELYCRIMGEEK